VVADSLKRAAGELRWPKLSDVVLHPTVLPDDNPHAQVFNAARVPCVPGNPSTPHFLVYELDNYPKDVVAKVFRKLALIPAVIFDCSGVGKSHLLMHVLSKRHGTFLVAGSPNEKDFGSLDVLTTCSFIENNVLVGGKTQDPIKARRFANLRVKYLLSVRLAVKEAWETHLGEKVSPWAWLLVQLHPVHFFGLDLFDWVVKDVLIHCHEDDANQTPPRDYLFVLDEAQFVQGLLADQLASQSYLDGITEDKDSRKSLLSAFVSTGREMNLRNFLLAGTGLSMARAVDAARTYVGSRTSGLSPIITGLPTFTPERVEEIGNKLLKGGIPNEVALWFQGRARPCFSFVGNCIEEKKLAMDMVDDYVNVSSGISPKALQPGMGLTLGDIIDKLERTTSTRVVLPDPTNILKRKVVRDAYGMFRDAVWEEVNGRSGKVSHEASLALVEAGLVRSAYTSFDDNNKMLPLTLEPLVLEAARRYMFLYSSQMALRIERIYNESFLGHQFERIAPFEVIPRLFLELEEDDDARFVGMSLNPKCRQFETHSLFPSSLELPVIYERADSNKNVSEKVPLPEYFKGEFRPAPPFLGRVVEKDKNVFDWFAKRKKRTAHRLMGMYPDSEARSDYCAILSRPETEDEVESTEVLAMLQMKMQRFPNVSDAIAATDPAEQYLAVIENARAAKAKKEEGRNILEQQLAGVTDEAKKAKIRKELEKAEGPTAFQVKIEQLEKKRTAFLEDLKTIPVIRIVISAGEAEKPGEKLVKVGASLVDHGREGAKFPYDLLIVIRGKEDLERVLGELRLTYADKKLNLNQG
jgi:hypothetical protein